MLLVELRSGPEHKRICKVEREAPSLEVEGEKLGRSTVYVKTRQHTARGLRIYVPQGEEPDESETLGWRGAAGIRVASDWKHDEHPDGMWHVRVEAHGHVVILYFEAGEVKHGGHIGPLVVTAKRLLAANFPRVREAVV